MSETTTKFPEGETVVAMTTTNYGELYIATNKGLYRVNLRAICNDLVPVKIHPDKKP